MKPGISLVTVLEKALDERGEEYYTATLTPALFKKLKKEFRVLLLKGNLLPRTLVPNHPQAGDNLFMFVETRTGEAQ
ncbi:MAG: hypothetical protein ACE15F_22310 [bacterium]